MNPLQLVSLILLVWNFLFFSAIAQDKELYIGADLSLDYGFRTLHTTANNYDADLLALRNNFETPAIGYHYGLSGLLKVKNQWLFNMGINYSIKGYNSTGPFSNQGVFYENQEIKNFYYFNYISSYLILNKLMTSNSVSYFFGVGLSSNYFLNAIHRSVTIIDENFVKDESVDDKIRTFKKWYLEGLLTVGVMYPYNDFLTLKFTPIFRYGLTYVNKKDEFSERLYSGSLQLSIFLTINQ